VRELLKLKGRHPRLLLLALAIAWQACSDAPATDDQHRGDVQSLDSGPVDPNTEIDLSRDRPTEATDPTDEHEAQLDGAEDPARDQPEIAIDVPGDIVEELAPDEGDTPELSDSDWWDDHASDEDLTDRADAFENICGGSEALEHELGTPCGSCQTWMCYRDGTLVCEGLRDCETDCPDGTNDRWGDRRICDRVVTLGFVTMPASESSRCQSEASNARWMDCDRDPHSRACAAEGRRFSIASSGEFEASPIEACQQIYGDYTNGVQIIDSADEQEGLSATDCPIYACNYVPCAESDLESAGPMCSVPERGLATAEIVDGYFWEKPEWVEARPNTGFYSSRLDRDAHINVRRFDVSWRQLNPEQGVFSSSAETTINASTNSLLSAHSFESQLSAEGDFWMRIWNSEERWAPEWVLTECPDAADDLVSYRGMTHLPIWQPCVWSKIMDLYRVVFAECEVGDDGEAVGDCALTPDGSPIPGWGLRSNPRFRYVYVPGAFKWNEYGLGTIETAAESGILTEDEYVAWFLPAMAELVDLMNGDPDSDDDDYAWKLVFTGEDFPYSVPDGWNDDRMNHFPRDVVALGMGIRNGIAENYNTHHHHVPAYGNTIAPNGHVVTDELSPAFDGLRMLGSENECFTSCGVSAGDNLEYHLLHTNFISLRMRMSWLYVSGGSYLDEYPDHWRWVRLSLGARIADADEAWAVLRETRDHFFDRSQPDHDWLTRPRVINLEQWLIQRDVCGDGWSRPGGTLVEGDLFYDGDESRSFEGRQTDRAREQDYLYFDVDDGFWLEESDPITLSVTYLDSGTANWHVEYSAEGCIQRTQTVENGDSGDLKTAVFQISAPYFDNSLPGDTDIRIFNGGAEDIDVHMVRLIRTRPRR